MMATERDRMAARLFLRAVLPVMKVLLTDDAKMASRFADATFRISFSAPDGTTPVGACVSLERGAFGIAFAPCDDAQIAFRFSTLAKMNAFFAGKPVVPAIRGWWRLGLLVKAVSLLMGLKILMPTADPKDSSRRRLKVKMTFFMITTALSQYNKGGDPEMARWTTRQPERIYQITVDEGIAAYLRVKAGKTKAGRGVYGRRKPFVHMCFSGVDGAYPIVMNRVNMVDAVRDGLLRIDGSPEYARDMGDFMMRIQELIT